jgi:hypothetical protein
MANLVHIKDICIYYTTLEPHAEECRQALALLDQTGIEAAELLYDHEPHHGQVFESLSTWGWGHNRRQRKFDVKFPLVHWLECNDDHTQHHHHAHGVEELKNSSLLKNASLCAKLPKE